MLLKLCLHINVIFNQSTAVMFVVVDFDCSLNFPIATYELIKTWLASLALLLDTGFFNVTSHLSLASPDG